MAEGARLTMRRRLSATNRQRISYSPLNAAIERLALSARARDRVLKVARTIADLAGAERVATEHLTEAVGYRALDRTPIA